MNIHKLNYERYKRQCITTKDIYLVAYLRGNDLKHQDLWFDHNTITFVYGHNGGTGFIDDVREGRKFYYNREAVVECLLFKKMLWEVKQILATAKEDDYGYTQWSSSDYKEDK